MPDIQQRIEQILRDHDLQDSAGYFAELLVSELGLTQEWTVSYDDGAAYSRPFHAEPSPETRRRAREMFSDRQIVSRYVTGWVADE